MKSLTPILIIVLCIGMYFLFISPTLAEIKGLSLKKAEYDNVLEKAQELKEKRDAILLQYNSIPQADIMKLNKIIPDRYDSVVFANAVNNLATQYGLKIESMRDTASAAQAERSEFVGEVQQQPYQTNTVSLRLTGKYDSFVSFLSNLESSLRLVDVQSLTITLSKEEVGVAQSYEFALEVSVYSLQ